MGQLRPADVNEVQHGGQDGKGLANDNQTGVPQDVGAAGYSPNITCFKCGQTGHPAFQCPSKGLGR
eukprot:12202863-Karenia_brevis.AAC.1